MKVVVVGHAGVGKSVLIGTLMSGTLRWRENHIMTREITVALWKTGGWELRMWDLPGQPEFNVSHHQFLSVGSRGVFVVVRLDQHLRIEYQLCYWLSVIEARQDRGVVSKIILVGTCSALDAGINRGQLLSDMRDAFQCLDVVDLHFISSKPVEIMKKGEFLSLRDELHRLIPQFEISMTVLFLLHP